MIVAALLAVYIGSDFYGVTYNRSVLSLCLRLCWWVLASAGTWISLDRIIGIILLIGIVKKNAIMMIDFALAAERVEGKSSRDAIFQACMLRFRPILMTTTAALLGALPLALGTGTGSELRRPLGISIIGGLLVSQMLTLFTTPVVYLYWSLRISGRLRPRIKPVFEPILTIFKFLRFAAALFSQSWTRRPSIKTNCRYAAQLQRNTADTFKERIWNFARLNDGVSVEVVGDVNESALAV